MKPGNQQLLQRCQVTQRLSLKDERTVQRINLRNLSTCRGRKVFCLFKDVNK